MAGRLLVVRLVCAAMAIVVVGGCSVMDELMHGDEPPVLVTVAEKEALGYERPEDVRNPGVQARAMANREEFLASVKPRVEERLGREVEIVGIDAQVPWDEVYVSYRTTTEPVVASSVAVGVGPEGEAGGMERIERSTLKSLTVSGLHHMAYRDEAEAMAAYLRQAYPQYTAMPEGYQMQRNEIRPDVGMAFHYTSEGEPPYNTDIDAAREAIYAAFTRQPVRTDAQWRELFETHASGVQRSIGVSLTLKNPEVAPTEAMAREVGEDIRSNPIFAGYDSWRVILTGGLMMREGRYFHEEYFLQATTVSPEWWVTHLIDGANV